MKTLLRWTGRSLLAIVLLLLLALGLVTGMLASDTGFRAVSQQLSQRVDGLETGNISGNLLGGIGSDAISYRNEAMNLQARGLESTWRLSCLFQREFCLDQLIIDELSVTTHDSQSDDNAASQTPVQLPSIQLPIDLTLNDVLVRKLTFQPPGDGEALVIENIHLAVTAVGSQIELDDLSLAYQDYSARAAGQVILQDDYPLGLTLYLEAADLLPDTLPEGEGAQSARVSMELANTLRELAVDARINGAIDAALTGTVQPLDADLPLSLRLDSNVIGWPLLSRAQVEASDLSIEVEGTRDDYALNLDTRINGEQLPESGLSIQGLVNTERLNLPRIDIETLGGSARGSARVTRADSLQWQTQWDMRNIDPSQQLPDVTGNLDASIEASGLVEDGVWTLELPAASIRGTLRDHPIAIDASLSKGRDDVWQIEQLRLDNQSNRIDASGLVDEQWDITATLDMPELDTLLPQLGGGFRADLAMKGPLLTPDVNLQASAAEILINDTRIQGISVIADIKRLFLDPGNLTIALGTVTSGGQTVNNTRLVLDGSRNSHVLSVFADGPQATAINLNASGSLDQDMNWSGMLDKVELELPAHEIALEQPTELAWNNASRRFSIDAHCWITEGSNLCLQERIVAAESGSATINLDRYPLERLNPFLPAETRLQGALQMNADIVWGDDQPGGFEADIRSVVDRGGAHVIDAEQNPVSFMYEELTLNTRINPQSIESELALRSENLGRATAAIRMDPSTEEKAIEGDVSLDGLDIGVARAFLPDFDQISGNISLDGRLSGQLSEPRFDGELVLDEPELQAEFLPLALTGGQVRVSISGRRAVIDGTLASAEGQIEIDGSANWQLLDAWRADVELIGENLNLHSEPLQESSIDHQIRIGARPDLIRVDGSIQAGMARIDVADLPQGAAGVSDDVIIIEDIEESDPQDAAAASSDRRIQMALEIELGDDVSLSAYGLNAQLTGDMTVRMTSPRPVQLAGEINVVEGIYKQYGQNLEANGQILFVGPVNQTRLAIDAEREIDSEDRTAGLRIQGTVETPEITLFTEPDDKSEDAILSYIVLGRDINETSDQEANLLATAALALTVKGGRRLGSGIADALGVEDFALETRGRGDDTELLVSGRVNDRLLLRYGRSVFEPSSTLYLRYDLTRKLYLEAAQGAERAVDLFYSFSF